MMAFLNKKTILVLLSFFAMSFVSLQTQAKESLKFHKNEIIVGKVIGIADGDTITILIEGNIPVKIRLAGIDCPEKNQAFGGRAKKTLSDKVFGNIVRVETRGKDAYDRVIGVVRLGDEDINEYLITQGVAWHFKRYVKQQPTEEATRYDAAETKAKNEKRGLWIQESPTAPWDFRDLKRNKDPS